MDFYVRGENRELSRVSLDAREGEDFARRVIEEEFIKMEIWTEPDFWDGWSSEDILNSALALRENLEAVYIVAEERLINTGNLHPLIAQRLTLSEYEENKNNNFSLFCFSPLLARLFTQWL